MAKEVIISNSRVNCYGSRVLTSGIDVTQFKRNPILLWMHRRGYGDSMPIGRIENLRIEGDNLIGTPVFDEKDEFAKRVAQKWEDDFLRMASAGIEIVEHSTAPELILQGQTRPTITRCKLEEVSIVDIGGNDDALKLYHNGQLLTLAKGEDSEHLPLLELSTPDPPPENQPQNQNKMNKEILQLLGLPETTTENDALGAIRLLKEKAEKVETLTLSSITAVVDAAVTDRRITADQKDHFIGLGKKAGIESLSATLALMKPTQKPTTAINPSADVPAPDQPTTFSKLSELSPEELVKTRETNVKEYIRLYKAEYGFEPNLS